VAHRGDSRVGSQPSSAQRAPGWAIAASLALSLVAVGISSYLTVAHYSDAAALACPDTGIVNCTLVTTSSWSILFGVPVAVIGLVWALAMAALTVPWSWQARPAWIRRLRLGLSAAGAAMVLYLVYVELFRIGAICLWCTAMHVTAVCLFGVVLAAGAIGQPTTPEPTHGRSRSKGVSRARA
jgi:uncharacterized membrane protein